jgi:hypothetical protein
MDNAGMPGTYKISTNFAIINATTLHNYEYVISDESKSQHPQPNLFPYNI